MHPLTIYQHFFKFKTSWSSVASWILKHSSGEPEPYFHALITEREKMGNMKTHECFCFLLAMFSCSQISAINLVSKKLLLLEIMHST